MWEWGRACGRTHLAQSFGGIALMKQSVAGLLLTLQVYIVYRIALAFEEPFTNYIYSERARKQSGKAKKK